MSIISSNDNKGRYILKKENNSTPKLVRYVQNKLTKELYDYVNYPINNKSNGNNDINDFLDISLIKPEKCLDGIIYNSENAPPIIAISANVVNNDSDENSVVIIENSQVSLTLEIYDNTIDIYITKFFAGEDTAREIIIEKNILTFTKVAASIWISNIANKQGIFIRVIGSGGGKEELKYNYNITYDPEIAETPKKGIYLDGIGSTVNFIPLKFNILSEFSKSPISIAGGGNVKILRSPYLEYLEKGSTGITENGFTWHKSNDTANISITGYYGGESEINVPSTINGYETSKITQDTFYNNSKITKVGIPENIQEFEHGVFRNCSNLNELTLSTDNINYFGYIFGAPLSLNNISNEAWVPASLKKVAITGKKINTRTFTHCSNLTSVVIGDSVTSIGDEAFSNCESLTSVTCPAFAISYLPKSKLQSVIITSGESIRSSAFSGCSSLTSVAIPDSVTSIGSSAFYNCYSLTNIYITDLTAWCKISGLYNLMGYGSTIKNLYLNNELVTELIIPDSVTSIGSSAFYECSSLTSIEIPNSVTSIGGAAFRNCSSLTSVVIPDSVTSIGDGAFQNCSSLTSITIGNGVTSIGDQAFYYCDNLTEIRYNATECADVKNSSHLFSDNTNRVITIGANVKKIPSYLFYGAKVASVTFEDESVCEMIGRSAFFNCDSLTSIEIPDSVTSIGAYAFSNCFSLTSVVIGDGVTSIGIYAFRYCNKLVFNEYENAEYLGNDNNPYHALIAASSSNSSCIINGNTKVIADNAFYDRGISGTVIIPEGVISIGNNAFGKCVGLKNVVIPSSVTTIGNYAFLISSAVSTHISGVYYKGDADEWAKVQTGTSCFGYTTSVPIYYYSDNEPAESNKYWRYVNGVPTVWGDE